MVHQIPLACARWRHATGLTHTAVLTPATTTTVISWLNESHDPHTGDFATIYDPPGTNDADHGDTAPSRTGPHLRPVFHLGVQPDVGEDDGDGDHAERSDEDEEEAGVATRGDHQRPCIMRTIADMTEVATHAFAAEPSLHKSMSRSGPS
jgi:hypothetical protein